MLNLKKIFLNILGLLNKVLSYYNLKVVKYNTSFYYKKLSSNSLLEVISNVGKSNILVDIPIAKFRMSLDGGISPLSDKNPWKLKVKTNNTICESSFASFKDFYNTTKTGNAHTFFKLKPDSSSILNGYQALEVPFPWLFVNSKTYGQFHKSNIINEFKSYGFDGTSFPGWAGYGSLTNEKLKLEWRRLTDTYESIRNNGYNRNEGVDGDIMGYFIIKDDKWLFWVTQGGHRLMALESLCHKMIPVRINVTDFKIYSIDSCMVNINNKNSYFTKYQVHELFDRLFS